MLSPSSRRVPQKYRIDIFQFSRPEMIVFGLNSSQTSFLRARREKHLELTPDSLPQVRGVYNGHRRRDIHIHILNLSLQHLCGDLEEAAPHLKDGTQERWTLSHHGSNAFEQRLLQIRRVDGVGSVGGSDDDRLPTTLHSIYERQKLGDDALLHLSVGLFTLGVMASISSMKTIAGAFFPPPSKALRRLDSASPAIFDMISRPLITKKKAPVSFATAQAESFHFLEDHGGGLQPRVLNS